jgi:NADH:ubiquinone oxidoreductase subunit H
LSIALLIFIRGGLPRYRFDHLTKVGWVKFLSLIVCFLLIELLFLYTVLS